MPKEINRKTHVQWIPAIGIAITVIDEITFIDPMEQYWQTTFKFNYKDPTTRSVHVVGFDPINTEPAALSDGTSFNVEVIDRIKVVDGQERGQGFWYTFGNPGNLDAPGASPETPPKHLKTHVTTIIGNLADFPIDDSSAFAVPGIGVGAVIAVERIDEISLIDPMDQYQEKIYKLDWEKEIENDQNLTIPPDQYELLSTSTDPKDFIVRLDPFQNIIAVNQKNYQTKTHYFITGDQVLSYPSHPINPNGSDFYAAIFIRPGGMATYVSGFYGIPGMPGLMWYFPPSPKLYPAPSGIGNMIVVNAGSPEFHNIPPPYFRTYDGPLLPPLPRTWRITFDPTAFLAGIYSDRTITLADKGSMYNNHIGETTSTADAQTFNLGPATPLGPDVNVVGGYYRTSGKIVSEYYLQWAVIAVPDDDISG